MVELHAHGRPNVSARTYQGTVGSHDDACVRRKTRWVWLIVTKKTIAKRGQTIFTMHAQEVIRPYQSKVVIEYPVRDIKSFHRDAPVRWTDAHGRHIPQS